MGYAEYKNTIVKGTANVKFNKVAQAFQAIEQENSRLAMTRLLADVLKDATSSEAGIICNIALGRLNPAYIGTQFNMAHKGVIKTVAKFLDETDADILSAVKKLGDMGLVLVNYSWNYEDELTVRQVYSSLEEIERSGGIGSQEEKMNKLLRLFASLDPISAKYVVRIILGKLRLGFSDMTLVDALSWMEVGDKSLRPIIEHAYNICADIGLIAASLKENGIEALEKVKIHLGIPIIPAAAERLPTTQAIMKKIGPIVVAQPKIDGFRLQIHVDNTGKKPLIHFFSRNMQDMTGMFPDLVEAFETLKVKQIICEGEAVAYDPNTGTFLPFQETVRRKRKHGISEASQEFPLQVFIFDVLYLNGESLLEVGHEVRRKAVLDIFGSQESTVVHVIEEKIISSPEVLLEYFNRNIAAGLEGLVVKRPNALYQPGKRNFNWIKLKRQEEGHLEDTLDCVVLGYYSGKGKRAKFGIGAFLVGVYNKDEDRFETIAKIGTGLADIDWVDLKNACDEIKVNMKPVNIECTKDLFPDVWVEPKMGCSIRADEITKSPAHTAAKTDMHEGFALRFPRFMGYRPDKSAYDASTVLEIEQMYSNQYVQ